MESEVLHLQQNRHTIILGMTESGKSTLADHLLQQFIVDYPKSRVLIIDSKPRFKAEWDRNGFIAASFYRGWHRGTFLHNSFRISKEAGAIKPQLQEAWSSRSNIAIAQARPGEVADLRWLEQVAETFYGLGDATPRLVYTDELADFFEVRKSGGIFWQTARSGRELGIALLAGSQRPAYIPKVVMTECTRLYLFHLSSEDDIKSVYSFGIPKDIVMPAIKTHDFFYWNKLERWDSPSGRYYHLKLEETT